MTASTKTRTKTTKAPKAETLPVREELSVPAYRGHEHPTVLRFGKYACGQTAIRGFDLASQEPIYMASIALPYRPAQGCVWIKTWGENSGLVDALIIARIITLTGRVQMVEDVRGKFFALEGRLLV